MEVWWIYFSDYRVEKKYQEDYYHGTTTLNKGNDIYTELYYYYISTPLRVISQAGGRFFITPPLVL